MNRLHAATTKHQQEIRAAGELREQHYRIYLPKRYRQVPVGRRLEVVVGLRFPGYIFPEFDIEKDEHGPINNTRSIGELICQMSMVDGQEKMMPVPLPLNWETEMRRHIDEEFEKATGKAKPDPRADLHHGDIVEIDHKGHAFHGQQGEYSRTENHEAIVWMGFVRVTIPEIDLKLIRAWDAQAAA